MNTEKEKTAIERLKSFEPKSEPYYLCYSGGKDSDCIRILASLAGVRHDIVNNHTTVDAPETVRYIRSIPNIHIEYPEKTMWQLIVEKLMPPTRLVRYCCAELKERGGKGRVKVTGVRWAESVNRSKNSGVIKVIGKEKTMRKLADEIGADVLETEKGGLIMNDDNDRNRRFVERCYRTTSTMVNPIVDWSDADVWEFLQHYGCKSNPLYQCGFNRIGCIGCPMSTESGMKRSFAQYPKYKQLYIRAFDKMVYERNRRGLATVWKNGKEVMAWWLGEDKDQISMFEEDEK